MSAAVGLQRTLRVLATTLNGAAVDVLVRGLDSKHPPVRVGSARALAARPDAEAHTQLLLALEGKPLDVRRALRNEKAVARLRGPAAAAIAGEDQTLCERACAYAVDVDDCWLLPEMIAAAMHADHPAGAVLGGAARRLAASLAAAVAAPPSDQASAGPGSYLAVRRSVLQSLGRAVERFAQHKRRELIDAMLLLAEHNSPILRAVFRDKSHPAREATLNALVHSPGAAAMDLLILSLEDERAPQALLDLASRRCDRPYVTRLLRRVGPRPALRVRTNARMLDGFAWAAADRRERLLELPGPEQAAAIRLFNATGSQPDDRSAIALMLLRGGVGEGRAAACESMRRVRSPEVKDLLHDALQDSCPEVIAAAAGQLRRHSIDDALPRLVELLDHDSPVVVAAAQRAMGEFSLGLYTEAYPLLTPEQRSAAGRLVGKTDPEAVATLARGISSPVAEKRISALQMITDLRLVDQLLTRVLHATQDTDTGVRAEAAAALGAAKGDRVMEALAVLLQDGSSGVRQAAETSLDRMGRLAEARQLATHSQADATADEPTLGEEEDLAVAAEAEA